MALSRSNRRTTDRISKTSEESSPSGSSSKRSAASPSQRKSVQPQAPEQTKASGSISKRAPATASPSQRKPVDANTNSNPTASSSKRSPAPTPAKTGALDTSTAKKTSASMPAKPATNNVAPKAVEQKAERELPPSSISKRQPIIPASEGKKTSGRLPAAESKSSSKVPIKPNIVSSSETTIAKSPNSLSSRKIVTNTNAEPEEAVKNPSKRSRAGASQKSGRSGKVAPKKSSSANNNIIYGILGAILLVLIILIVSKATGGNDKQKIIVKANNLDSGVEICRKARDMYNSDREKSPEALELLEQGISMINSALDPMRDSQNNLPANMRGYDSKLADWNGFRKTLKEEAFQVKARKERANK